MFEKNNTTRLGTTLEDHLAHERDHHLWSRRDFLSASGILGAGSIMLGKMGLRSFQPTPLMAALANGSSDRILVMIRLDGGNDGLNTIIERENPNYYSLRPTIAVKEPNLWNLNTQFAMPKATEALQGLWNEGMMKVILNVGYPQPNYSHFRSYDIVASASDSNTIVNTGWIGRFLDNEYAAFLETPPTIPPALQIGVQSDLVFKAQNANMALAVSSPQEFYQIAQTGQLYETATLGTTPRDLELAYVRQTANSAFRYATTIKESYARGKNQVDYPLDNYLGEQLAIVAKLIKGNLGTRIFMVEIGGFDTHADQYDAHLGLLNDIATAVKSFYEDLELGNAGLSEKVLGMTFSEFGRTIYENGSLGTDHGWGTPMLMFGGGIGNGVVGTYQDLTNPDPFTDPEFSIDFRDVYATVLKDWMGSTPELVDFVLGQTQPTIAGLVPATSPLLGENGRCALLGHNPGDQGNIQMKYAMLQDGNIRLQLLDKSGQILRTLVDEYKAKGSYIFNFKPSDWFIVPGTYQYRLMGGGQVFQRSIKIG
ncbi:MAG: hypothetical protein RIR11_588 [Bacteroidota bacterium]|jgi:uncharacterized protein (DUF1501 family)